jgi:hypothetical protein
MDQVPADQFEMNVAPRGACCDNLTDFAQIIVAVTFALACARPLDPGEEVMHIDEARLAQLGPAASARELLEIRRELLGHIH